MTGFKQVRRVSVGASMMNTVKKAGYAKVA